MQQAQPTYTIKQSSASSGWHNSLRSWLRGTVLAVLAGVGFYGSYWGYMNAQEVEIQELKANFQGIANTRSQNIENYLNLLLDVTHGASVFARNSKSMPKELFQSYASDIFERHRAYRALAWVPLITDQQRPTYESLTSTVIPDFAIKQSGDNEQVHRADKADSYLPLQYLEFSSYYGSTAKDRALIGLDFRSNKEWLRAMTRAQQKGSIAISLQGASSRDVLAFAPVFKAGLPSATKSQRLENLQGFVVAVLQVADLVESGAHQAGAITEDAVTKLYVLVDNRSKRLLFPYVENTSVAADSQLASLIKSFSSSADFGSAGQQWSVQSSPSAEFFDNRDVTTPWVILGSGSVITLMIIVYLITLITRQGRIEKLVKQRTSELDEAHEKLRESEMMVMQSEKMSSLGQMVAGVAHEINTPLGFVTSNMQLMQDYLHVIEGAFSGTKKMFDMIVRSDASSEAAEGMMDLIESQSQHIDSIVEDEIFEDAKDNIRESLTGLKNISEIVTTLKDFSRVDRSLTGSVDIQECLNSTLIIAQNEIKDKAEIIKEYHDIPLISCAPSKLNQVFLNLINNAAHSLDRRGTITIRTDLVADKIKIEVEDNGCGMTEDVAARIFDPFYTTKEIGKGTGLGLSIAYKIIEEHSGEIMVESTPGVGTKFIINLPIDLDKQQANNKTITDDMVNEAPPAVNQDDSDEQHFDQAGNM